jgi:hypothetical protein
VWVWFGDLPEATERKLWESRVAVQLDHVGVLSKRRYRIHCRLLCPRRERPCGSRAAQKRDELAAFHVWMAPAWQEKM